MAFHLILVLFAYDEQGIVYLAKSAVGGTVFGGVKTARLDEQAGRAAAVKVDGVNTSK